MICNKKWLRFLIMVKVRVKLVGILVLVEIF